MDLPKININTEELPKTITIKKKQWSIKYEKPDQGKSKLRTYGECNYEEKVLTIDPNDVDFLDFLCTCAHELLHAHCPELSENKVTNYENNLKKLLKPHVNIKKL